MEYIKIFMSLIVKTIKAIEKPVFRINIWDPVVLSIMDHPSPDDLNIEIHIPRLFKKRVQNDMNWSFITGTQSHELLNCNPHHFSHIYKEYEQQGKIVEQVDAYELFMKLFANEYRMYFY
jgi:hypothetical protein